METSRIGLGGVTSKHRGLHYLKSNYYSSSIATLVIYYMCVIDFSIYLIGTWNVELNVQELLFNRLMKDVHNESIGGFCACESPMTVSRILQ